MVSKLCCLHIYTIIPIIRVTRPWWGHMGLNLDLGRGRTDTGAMEGGLEDDMDTEMGERRGRVE